MDEKEIGEISLKIVKHKIKKEGIRQLDPKAINRSLGNVVKETGIPAEKLKEYFRIIMPEVVINSYT